MTDSDRQERVSKSDLEQQLRGHALLRMQTPPARLRARIVALAHDSVQDSETCPRRSERRGRTLVFAAVALIIVSVGGLYAIRAPEMPPEQLVIEESTQAISARVAQVPRAVDRALAAPARLDVSAPLRSEARLLALDVERTYHVIRASLPRRPRISDDQRTQ